MNKRPMGINFVIVSLCFLVCLSFFVTGYSDKPQKEYGVFLGINADHIERLNDYRLVVIEPSEFHAEHIQELHAEGKMVYGYINIGSIIGLIEEYRPYYDHFKYLTLDVYENWLDEHWMYHTRSGNHLLSTNLENSMPAWI